MVSSLGVSTREDWVPVYYVRFMFRGRPLLFSAVVFFADFLADFEDFSRCAFSLQGKKKSLSFLTFP